MRFALDASWQRFDRVVVAGSPLTIFRTTAAGARVVDDLEQGRPVDRSRLTERMLEAGAIHPAPDVDAADDGDAGDRAGAVTIVTPQLGGVIRDDGRLTVDDGSQPPLAGAALRLDANRGPAAARNAARPLVHTALVAFLDADVDTRPDAGADTGHGASSRAEEQSAWLRPLLPHFDDPRVGLVAPRVLGEHGSSLDMGAEPARIRAGTRVSYVPAAAIVARVAALDEIGWFDESLRFGEDVDLVWRLDRAGWRCRYEPRATVWHRPRPSLPARLRQQVAYGTSAAPLAVRHPGNLAPLRTNGWTAASWALLAAGQVPAGVLLAVGSAAALPRKLPQIPASAAISLAMRGHLAASQQLAHAIRRAWWPIVAVAALRSRRTRWIGLAALCAAPRRALRDLAYGVGVWKGMVRERTIAPIVPAFDAWPRRRR